LGEPSVQAIPVYVRAMIDVPSIPGSVNGGKWYTAIDDLKPGLELQRKG
jgi:hypothetical protein